MDQWYALVGGSQYGPVPLETLRQWLQEGRMTSQDHVWSPGMANWLPARDVPELAAAANLPTSYSPSMQPHRGTVVLVLGILGLAMCFILGIVAWVMGNNDLREIDNGQMDPSGRGLTQAGRICGMISVILNTVIIGAWILMMIIMMIIGLMATATA